MQITMLSRAQYLRIIGTLYPDNRLKLMPCYLTTNERNSKEDPESALIAELYDKEEKLLLRYHVSARPYEIYKQASTELAVRGKIPFPPTTYVVKFFRSEVLVHEILVSKGKPMLSLTWEPLESVRAKQTITWIGEHPEEKPLQYFLRYTNTNGKSWQRIGWRTKHTKAEVDFDQLPGGTQCRIAVIATDGVNTVTVESKTFSVDVKPCKAMILFPKAGARFGKGEMLLLRGQGFYLEENRAETEALIWTSSTNDELGRGMTIQISGLSPGTHYITLTAGTGERTGKVTISIEVDKEIKQ